MPLGQSAVMLCAMCSIWCIGAHASDLCVKVVDEADLPLPKAWINVTKLSDSGVTGASGLSAYHAAADESGKSCMTVPEGIYSVEVGRVGFLNVRYYPVRVLYPDLRELFFRLPIGDVTEGAIAAEAILNGTLMFAGKPVKGATVCIRTLKDNTVVVCGLTNVFGEYALAAPPGKYQVQVRTALGELHETTVDVSQAGVHRSRIKLDQKKK